MTEDKTEVELRIVLEEIEAFGRTAKIKSGSMEGIVLELGEGICGPWKPGDLLVYWDHGETTCLPDVFEIIKVDLFKKEVEL